MVKTSKNHSLITCNSFSGFGHFIVPEKYQVAGLMAALRLDLSFVPKITKLGENDFVVLG